MSTIALCEEHRTTQESIPAGSEITQETNLKD